MINFIWDNDDSIGQSLDNFEEILNQLIIEYPVDREDYQNMLNLLSAAKLEHYNLLKEIREFKQQQINQSIQIDSSGLFFIERE
jgi:hypothetical protein